MTSEVRSKKNLTPVLLILIIMSVLTLTKFLVLFTGWGEYFKNIIWAFDERPLFYDHFDHIKYSLQGNITGVYNVNVNACFPAFAYFFYGFLAHLCTVDQIGTADFAHVLNTNSGVVTLVFVYGIFFVSIALLLSKQLTSKIGEYYTNAFIILLLLSSIFLMTVASGNLTIGAMILTLFCGICTPLFCTVHFSVLYRKYNAFPGKMSSYFMSGHITSQYIEKIALFR